MMGEKSSHLRLENHSRIGASVMTSKPRFIQYIDRIQNYLSLFSTTDSNAQEYLRGKQLNDEDRPKFLLFEMLLNDPHRNTVRVFEPYVYDPFLDTGSPEAYIADLKRLYENAKQLEIDWQAVDWERRDDELVGLPDHKSDILKGDMLRLDEYYSRFCESSDQTPSQQEIDDIRTVLKKLVKRYEFEYIPVNFGASALIYEAWQEGKFQLFSSSEGEEEFRKLIDALFIDANNKVRRELLLDMAEDLGLLELTEIDKSSLSSGDIWTRKFLPWFACVEKSLIHKFEAHQTLDNSYLIHFPLIIDSYWFAGFCYVYATWNRENSVEKPELFIKEKYPKFYSAVQSVSETLKFSLRADALSKTRNLLIEKRSTDPNDIFADVIKDYFVCFDVVRIPEGTKAKDVKPLNRVYTKRLYSRHGVNIYGPQWISKKHIRLIINEIDGEGKAVGYYRVPGLYEEVISKTIEEDKRVENEGRRQQAYQFAHQGAGLINEIWRDPSRELLSNEAQACLWQLKSLNEVWGDFDLEANQSIFEGSGASFRDWTSESRHQLFSYLVNVGLTHALQRATRRRAEETENTEELDAIVRQRADDLIFSPAPITEMKKQLFWRDLDWGNSRHPDWFEYRAFVLSFHHCFWQAAYHGFRAMCDGQPQPYLWIQNVSEHQITIVNRQERVRETRKLRSRDEDFYELIQERINQSLQKAGAGKLEIIGPQANEAEDTWEVSITYLR